LIDDDMGGVPEETGIAIRQVPVALIRSRKQGRGSPVSCSRGSSQARPASSLSRILSTSMGLL
jgi:hypothetical protein